jgi:hypothetical protein
MRSVSDKRCTKNQNTHFVLKKHFFENSAVYDIMWSKLLELGRRNGNMAHAHFMLNA